MNVVARIEISDLQRNILGQMLHPTAPKSLATRTEVREFVAGCVAALGILEENSGPTEPPPTEPSHSGAGRVYWIQRLRQEDPAFCAGRTDGFVWGAAMVAYARELRHERN